MLADAIAEGYHTDTALTLEAMRATAEMNVFGLGAYQESGFLNEDESESVSKTLEYAYDDACIAWTAERLGNLGIMNGYKQRASAYRSLGRSEKQLCVRGPMEISYRPTPLKSIITSPRPTLINAAFPEYMT